MTYVVGRNPKVNEQIRSLAEAAKTLGISDLFRDALLKSMAELAARPLEFGDPEFRMKFVDGVVCHGVCQPLLVRYAVFDTAKTVQVLEIKAFPGSVFYTR